MNIERKRVLLIAANDMGKSGVPNVYMNIVRNLSNDYIFDIVISRENYYYKNEFLSYGGNIYLIKERLYNNKFKRIFWRLFGSPFVISNTLKGICKNNHYSIIHSFKGNESAPYFRIAKKFSINNRILHINSCWENTSNPLSQFFIKMERLKTIKYSTNHIAVSKLAGDTYFKNLKYNVIYNTYDEKDCVYCENDSQNLVLLQIGTTMPIKNQLFSIQVLSKIKTIYPDCHLIFITTPYDSRYDRQCRKEIEKLKLWNNVTFLPPNINQNELYKQATFVLLPSLQEGFSLVTVESQARGVHTFISDTISKEIDCGNVSYLKLDTQLWAKTIIAYYKHNNNKRKKVDMSKFSLCRFIDSIYEIYNI